MTDPSYDYTSLLEGLHQRLMERKNASGEHSYVASLYEKGLNKILEKVGEESFEVVLAAKDVTEDGQGQAALVSEIADLWFHIQVLLAHQNIDPSAVFKTLEGRAGISGHEEKAQRSE